MCIRDRNKPTNRERLREITDGIEQGIKELFESEKYKMCIRDSAWSGAPALYPGVITKLEKVSRALQAVSGRAFRGSSLMDNGAVSYTHLSGRSEVHRTQRTSCKERRKHQGTVEGEKI